ncbi:hypothetical protein LFL96_26680 [Paraburkholderia sp. D15]|uniref:hypothetical protein n=1 Tax=Paraburkholderia sp. D15 TaxID=2880218 RepID=UPI002478F5B8|nr:hypothetical protein [Paraburkholderia sp. D15]WGS54598.1 hypothetical protein LFL96_26680 [Paraburkholderia sp. D15]
MQTPKRSPFIAARRLRQRGQACTEYLVVTTALVAVLLIAKEDTLSPFAALLLGLKSFFGAYSFALSLP